MNVQQKTKNYNPDNDVSSEEYPNQSNKLRLKKHKSPVDHNGLTEISKNIKRELDKSDHSILSVTNTLLPIKQEDLALPKTIKIEPVSCTNGSSLDDENLSQSNNLNSEKFIPAQMKSSQVKIKKEPDIKQEIDSDVDEHTGDPGLNLNCIPFKDLIMEYGNGSVSSNGTNPINNLFSATNTSFALSECSQLLGLGIQSKAEKKNVSIFGLGFEFIIS